jgi:hemolysin activation/secretion protein
MVAQDANHPLLTFEELAVGNLTIGRGYDPSSVAGDRGIAGSIEPRLGPWYPLAWMQVSPYAFYDVAYVKYIDSIGESVTVHSAGAGLRVSLLQKIDLDIAYSVPFDKPTVASASVPTPRVLASLTLRY